MSDFSIAKLRCDVDKMLELNRASVTDSVAKAYSLFYDYVCKKSSNERKELHDAIWYICTRIVINFGIFPIRSYLVFFASNDEGRHLRVKNNDNPKMWLVRAARILRAVVPKESENTKISSVWSHLPSYVLTSIICSSLCTAFGKLCLPENDLTFFSPGSVAIQTLCVTAKEEKKQISMPDLLHAEKVWYESSVHRCKRQRRSTTVEICF